MGNGTSGSKKLSAAQLALVDHVILRAVERGARPDDVLDFLEGIVDAAHDAVNNATDAVGNAFDRVTDFNNMADAAERDLHERAMDNLTDAIGGNDGDGGVENFADPRTTALIGAMKASATTGGLTLQQLIDARRAIGIAARARKR